MDGVMSLRRRSRREWLATAVVGAGLLAFVTLVYAVVVLAGGALLGRPTSSPAVALSVLATAVVALTFDRVSSWLGGLVSRAVHGGRPSPYDVLGQFSGTAAGGYAAEELPSRMARVLAVGTGAQWSQVWLVLDGKPRLGATWPPDAPLDAVLDPTDTSVRGRRSQPVLHDGELLGLLVVQERDQVPLTSVEERLFAGLAVQSRLVLRGARLRVELEQRAAELSTRAEELRASRQRLVDAQDNERRALERDVHDGAQQHLVALAVNLRLAETLAARSPERAVPLLEAQEAAAADAVETVLQLSQGIYPPLLADGGLEPALRAASINSATPVDLTADGLGRYPPGVEAAAYFCCLEALQNAAKHARASTIRIELRGAPDGSLTFRVSDDGCGFDPDGIPAGSGLTNMRDRLDAVDGVLTLSSSSGSGTLIEGRIPGGERSR
ncbi:histidine kinase [Nocardioides sp. HM23]|uniref:GAF domain-containing sensor histidine kinase n=1 Tax=Nocardioides bizhenqiangii TaxID=3095076 RepID=UPI002ACA523E|nr:ATP-binding protein [Nocardioides sp. HM23]MDZ5619401.1 histidine kinase [Nocardioides sp. HM23]